MHSFFGSYVKLALLALFVILALVFIISGQSKGTNLNPANLIPSNFALIVNIILPVIIFQCVGFELQNGAGEEMHNPQRDVPRAIIRSGAIAVVAYAVFLTFIVLALPKSQLTNVGGFLSAFLSVSGVLPAGVAKVLGWLIAIGYVLALASSGGTWVIGADRTYAMSALDRTAPRLLGRFSGRYGTPIAVDTMTGITASITAIVAILISELFSGGSLGSILDVVIVCNMCMSTIAMLIG